MKSAPIASRSLHKLDILCGFLSTVLGSQSLKDAPVLLSGYRSVANSRVLRTHQVELQNLRALYQGMSTEAALRAVAARYNDGGADGPSVRRNFVIDEKTLTFRQALDMADPTLMTALEVLKVPASHEEHGLLQADPTKPLYIMLDHLGEKRRYPVSGLPDALPAAANHDGNERSTSAVRVTWQELLDQADAMDAIDKERASSRPGNWKGRLLAAQMESLDPNVAHDVLDLVGVKHLIGLPGVGKTTLLMCLLRHCASTGVRVAMFLPSIEMCRQYLDALHDYGVTATLLMGQSVDTRTRHAFKLAESIATGDRLRGYAQTSDSASMFEGVCALPAFTAAPLEAFSAHSRFCREVEQPAERGEKYVSRLCPAWSVCSYNRASRKLPTSQVWLGHVLSSDTQVPAHTTAHRQRYFELISQQFDLVIFDEADQAQRDLDMNGVSQLRLSGYAGSFHHDAQMKTLQLLARGSNSRLGQEQFAQIAIDVADFEKLNVILLTAIQRLNDELLGDLNAMVLTPLRLIGEWLAPKRRSGLASKSETDDAEDRTKNALTRIWQQASYDAFQNRAAFKKDSYKEQDRKKAEERDRHVSTHLRSDIDSIARLRDALRDDMRQWLAAVRQSERAPVEESIRKHLSPYLRKGDEPESRLMTALLLAVTFTILSYRRLAPSLKFLSESEGVRTTAVEQRASDELLSATPDNLLGNLSGVRFFRSRRATGNQPRARADAQLQYVVFSGAPRALLYQMHQWVTAADGQKTGPAVLLTSATSFMPASPSYHIDVGPHYLVKRADVATAGDESRYVFRPIPTDDQLGGSGHLRFSGQKSESTRLRVLEKMAEALLSGAKGHSQLEIDCSRFDVRYGMARKAAFVVNSYDQCAALKSFIDFKFPAWRDRVVAVVRELPEHGSSAGFVTAAKVEAIGDDPSWELLIFPMGALGRGANIVFSGGPRRRDAAIGTLYFLTRPHPSPEDLSLLVGLAARATQDFNASDLSDCASIGDLQAELKRARRRIFGRVGRLLRLPVYSRSLGALLEPFTGDSAVMLLQTIGRAMRNGCPVQSFFVDEAWASRSAAGEEDDANSSMLVQLLQVLQKGAASPHALVARLNRELYGPFLKPLERIEGLRFGHGESAVRSVDSGLGDRGDEDEEELNDWGVSQT